MTIVLGFILLILVLLALFVVAIHWGFRAPRLANAQTPADFGLDYSHFNITSEQHKKLACWWIPATEASRLTIVILHGWGANKSTLLPFAKHAHAMNANVLLFDAHNHGDSDSRGTSTMPKFAQDLNVVLAWLKTDNPDQAKQMVVMGHSVGAAAVLMAGAINPIADAYIAISSFAHPALMMQRQLGRLAKIPGLLYLISAYVQWVIGHRFDDIAPITSLRNIKKPVLCVHGTADRLIPLSDHHLLCQSTESALVACHQVVGADHDSIDLIDQHFSVLQNFIAHSLVPKQ